MIIDRCPQLKIISKYGVGIDNIDMDATARSGIQVGWTPGLNKRSVSELTLCFMLGGCRNVFRSILSMKEGKWVKSGDRELSRSTVGIVGFGNVGKDVATLLKPFDVRLLANDIVAFAEKTAEYTAEASSLDGLMHQADVISVHLPLTPLTKGMFDKQLFSLMKPETLFINTSRGEVAVEEDLLWAIDNLNISAALDVFAVEPAIATQLTAHRNVFPTPHIGGNSQQAILATGRAASARLVEFAKQN